MPYTVPSIEVVMPPAAAAADESERCAGRASPSTGGKVHDWVTSPGVGGSSMADVLRDSTGGSSNLQTGIGASGHTVTTAD